MVPDAGELAQAAAGGDPEAVEKLLHMHLPALQAFVRLRAGGMLRAHESSSDLVQSVCREVLSNIADFRYPGEGAFKAWLYTTALRKISNRVEYYRAEKRDARREVAADDLDYDRLLGTYRSFSSPSYRAGVKDEVARIENAFAQMPDEYREVITLAHVAGLSRAEIAAHMGRSEEAVRALLHRALVRTAELLEVRS
jgi:RNA polymerase sigma-70 factor, ECF subfamily